MDQAVGSSLNSLWAEFRGQLKRDGFTEANARRLLGVPELVQQKLFPCEEPGPAAEWVNFWLVGQAQERQGDWVEFLLELGLLERLGSRVRALATLTPCQDVYLLADPQLQPDSRTYAMLRVLPPRPALHLNCGAGLLPLLWGGPCQDGNSRAMAFAELNAALNGRPFQPRMSTDLVTLVLPMARPARGQAPQNPDLGPYLEGLPESASLAVACSLVRSLNFPGYDVQQWDYAFSSLTDYAASQVDRGRLLQAFGPDSGEQAYREEVYQVLRACQDVKVISDSLLLIKRGGGSHSVQKIAYPLAEPEPKTVLPEVRPVFRSAYNEANLRELLDLPEVLFTPEQLSGLLFRLAGQSSDLARQAEYWLLQQPRRGRRARAMLFPCLDQLIFADPMFSPRLDQIYWLGPDSLVLARSVPRQPRRRSLDLCTGSGIQAILNARHCGQNMAVDINPRAVARARLNARVNGVSLEVLQGSLFGPITDGLFDLITANPPFVPTPEPDLQLFRPGGESGEEVTAEIIRALPQRLGPGGLLALVSQCPILADSQPLERVREWLGEEQGWGLAQLRFGKLDRAGLIASHTSHPEEFARWWESYRKLGIQGAHLAVTLVGRLRPDHPGFQRTLDLQMPAYSISASVSEFWDGWSA